MKKSRMTDVGPPEHPGEDHNYVYQNWDYGEWVYKCTKCGLPAYLPFDTQSDDNPAPPKRFKSRD